MTPTKQTSKNPNGWDTLGYHVIEELKRLSNQITKLDTSVNNITVDIGKLKIKSGIFGAIGASIPIFTGLIIYFISIIVRHGMN